MSGPIPVIFNPNAGGKVRVVVDRSTPADDADIVVTVADNGQGDAFDAAERPRKSGIGKQLVEGLLRQLKGRMTIEKGAGLTTKLFLPQPRTI